jgi:hypothetical protein
MINEKCYHFELRTCAPEILYVAADSSEHYQRYLNPSIKYGLVLMERLKKSYSSKRY